MTARASERIAIGGRELEFVRIPPSRPAMPTLVFLHEGLGSMALWRDFPERLARRTGFGALVYSRYGNGFSSGLSERRGTGYMHDEALATLPALLETLEIDETVLVGQSDGGSIALIFAAGHPSMVLGLVLEAPHVFVEPLSVASIAAIKVEYERGELRERLRPYHLDVDRTFYGWNDVWLTPEFAEWNIEQYVRRVTSPTLAVQGLEDEYGTVGQIDAIARQTPAPVDRIVLSRCGHAPHRERPELVESAMAAWLEERCARD